MTRIKQLKMGSSGYPDQLNNIPSPPKQLYMLGTELKTLTDSFCLAVVGSRRVSSYGRFVTETFAQDLARQGIVIVSGLALGVDALAHKAALDAGGKTIAVLPCGLDQIYPSSNRSLSKRILEQGGAVISEYPEGTDPFRQNFIARNRIVSGLSRGVLITEAAEKSGTLHTANFALEQGREVMAVPGNITSPLSAGTNQLIKTGATPITTVEDIMRSLGLETSQHQETLANNEQEYIILTLIKQGCLASEELLQKSGLKPEIFNQTLTMLEITGRIKPLGGQWIA